MYPTNEYSLFSRYFFPSVYPDPRSSLKRVLTRSNSFRRIPSIAVTLFLAPENFSDSRRTVCFRARIFFRFRSCRKLHVNRRGLLRALWDFSKNSLEHSALRNISRSARRRRRSVGRSGNRVSFAAGTAGRCVPVIKFRSRNEIAADTSRKKSMVIPLVVVVVVTDSSTCFVLPGQSIS